MKLSFSNSLKLIDNDVISLNDVARLVHNHSQICLALNLG